MKYIDLQVHTNMSDGVFSPSQIVDFAVAKKMKAIAITDHDTVGGIEKAVHYAKDKDVMVVPGIEISCWEPEFVSNIDIIGLFIDYKEKGLTEFLENLRQHRIKEKNNILRKLRSLGYKVSFSELLKEAGETLGRPHIARILMRKYPEEFSSVQEVFNKLIGEGKRAFVGRKKARMAEAISVIEKARGISILAHPGRYLREAEKIAKKFAELGGKGIEIDYPYKKIIKLEIDTEPFKKIAREKKILVSGGSDFHDKERGVDIGDGGVTEDEFQMLLKYKELLMK